MMTEYDSSPDSYHNLLATQRRVADWVDDTRANKERFGPPFEVHQSRSGRPLHSARRNFSPQQSARQPHSAPIRPRQHRRSSSAGATPRGSDSGLKSVFQRAPTPYYEDHHQQNHNPFHAPQHTLNKGFSQPRPLHRSRSHGSIRDYPGANSSRSTSSYHTSRKREIPPMGNGMPMVPTFSTQYSGTAPSHAPSHSYYPTSPSSASPLTARSFGPVASSPTFMSPPYGYPYTPTANTYGMPQPQQQTPTIVVLPRKYKRVQVYYV